MLAFANFINLSSATSQYLLLMSMPTALRLRSLAAIGVAL